MTLAKKAFKNISYLLIARTIFRFLTAAVLIYAANYLGDERFGMLETATAWANVFLALNDIGMSTLIVREAARDKKKMAIYFGNTLAVEVIVSILLFGILIGIGYLLHYDDITITLIAIMAAAGLIFEFRKVMRGIFRVLMQLKFVAFLEVINGALYLALAIGIFATITDKDLGLLGLAHTRLWVNVIIIIALLAYTLKFIRPKFDFKQIPAMVKQSYVFTLYNMFFMLYFQIDQIILSIMGTNSDVGIYGAPAKVVNLFLFIPLMVFQVTMPIMYRYSKKNIEKYKRINNAMWRYLAAFGIPAGVGLWYLADLIIPLLFTRPEYLASIPIMGIMGWFLAIRFTGIGQGNSMTTSDRQGLRAGIQVASLVLNIVLDIYLIKQYGVKGAAIATLITEATIATSYLWLSAKHLNESVWHNLLSLSPIIGATTVMILVLSLAKGHFHVIVLMILGVLIYTLFLWIFRFFRSYDRELITQIIAKKAKQK